MIYQISIIKGENMYTIKRSEEYIDEEQYIPEITPDQFKMLLIKAGKSQADFARFIGITRFALQYWWNNYEYMLPRHIQLLRAYLGEHIFLCAIRAYNNGLKIRREKGY